MNYGLFYGLLYRAETLQTMNCLRGKLHDLCANYIAYIVNVLLCYVPTNCITHVPFGKNYFTTLLKLYHCSNAIFFSQAFFTKRS